MISQERNSATLQELIQYALPLGTNLLTGSREATITWAVTVRAQPPAFPDIYGGELALVSMDILRSYDARITVADVVRALSEVGVGAIAAYEPISPTALDIASQLNIGLLSIPTTLPLTNIERSINKYLLNQSAQMTERAMDIQRRLTRLAAENRDLNSMLRVISDAIGRAIVVHDEASVLQAQVYPNLGRRGTKRNPLQELPYGAFQSWLETEQPNLPGVLTKSPIGFTTPLQVEKRIAGYLSIVDQADELDDYARLIVTYGSDICAIEMAKNRAIEVAVEQARGDWVQMWLSGTPTDTEMIFQRALQTGFELNQPYICVVYRPISVTTSASQLPSLEHLSQVVRDEIQSRQINGAVGEFVDVIVLLYPVTNAKQSERIQAIFEEIRQQLMSRIDNGTITAGVGRQTVGLNGMREAYREARDAVNIALELDEIDRTTYYSDLKLYQFLLAIREHQLPIMQNFLQETIEVLVEHDERKQGELVRTLTGFFEANGNLAKAAETLSVHRNTLVYRLDRIGELTGMDLNDPENRLILNLALRIQRVLTTLS